MSRATSQTSTTSGNTANGLQRSLSLKTNTKLAFSNALQPSDVKLFVTNLRLLELDRRQDWPDITTQTFSAKNADQKQRIAAVEWSLFRLFETWDPAETSQKLQPFFPPLEPLQSRNLRIALHRSLDGLKKDGVLGRETVLRKTMLDECKGEKFYEILASFSSIVLKKVLASQPQQLIKPSIARTLATSNSLSNREQTSLLPLAIAHKAALTNVLRRKEEKRTRYTKFSCMLDAKADEINQRIRKAAETPRASKPAIPQREADAIKKQLKDNWVGDQKWVGVMLHGDDIQGDAVYLNSSFEKVWKIVEQGRRLEDAVPEAGLLENLQIRVDEQNLRLQGWKSFYERMQEETTVADKHSRKPTVPAKEFKFDDHLQLQLQSPAPRSKPVYRAELRPAYQDIMLAMDDELSQAASARYNQSSTGASAYGNRAPHSPTRRRKSRSDSISKKPANFSKPSKPVLSSRRPSVEDTVLKRPIQSHRPPAATPADSEATLIGQASSFRTATAMFRPDDESPTERLPVANPPEGVSDSLSAAALPEQAAAVAPPPLSSSPAPSSYYPSEPPVLELPSVSNEEALAAQIVSTIGDATPSPVKKSQPRMSLMERTRMSMARTTSFEPVPESPDLLSPTLPEPPTVPDRNATLMERTRLSMAAMTSRPRVSLAPKDKRKPKRESLFPVNQFDTPRNRKSFHAIEEAKDSSSKTPKEDLFSDDVDYDRVFRSRPRVATSPIFGTPVGDRDGGFDEGVTGVDLADVDADEDEGRYEREWEQSPLRARAFR